MSPIVAFALTLSSSTFLWSISSYFKPRFNDCDRVVMHWGFDGQPNSYAPASAALLVTPVLGTFVLLGIAALLAFASPEEVGSLAGFAVILSTAAVFCAIHFLHMHFAARSAECEGGG